MSIVLMSLFIIYLYPEMYKYLKLYTEQTKAIKHKILMTLNLILWKIEEAKILESKIK